MIADAGEAVDSEIKKIKLVLYGKNAYIKYGCFMDMVCSFTIVGNL